MNSEKDNSCEFCNRYFTKKGIFFHAVLQCTCLVILLVKYLIWSMYTTRFELPHTFPCKRCKHVSYVHLLVPDQDPKWNSMSLDPSNVLFYTMLPSKPVEQQFCMECAWIFSKGLFKDEDMVVDHAYIPCSNLDYMESKYGNHKAD